MKRPEAAILLILMLGLVAVQPVYAYLDPGTGSILFQVVVAAFLSTLYFFKALWRKPLYFIKRIFSRKSSL